MLKHKIAEYYPQNEKKETDNVLIISGTPDV